MLQLRRCRLTTSTSRWCVADVLSERNPRCFRSVVPKVQAWLVLENNISIFHHGVSDRVSSTTSSLILSEQHSDLYHGLFHRVNSTHGWDQAKVWIWILNGESSHSKCISKPFSSFSVRYLNHEIRLLPEKSHPWQLYKGSLFYNTVQLFHHA